MLKKQKVSIWSSHTTPGNYPRESMYNSKNLAMCAYCCSIHKYMELQLVHVPISIWKYIDTLVYNFLFSHKKLNFTISKKINWTGKQYMWSNQGSAMHIIDFRFYLFILYGRDCGRYLGTKEGPMRGRNYFQKKITL